MGSLKHRWVDISAIVIALAALWVSLTQMRAQRLHDRLSVHPHVAVSYFFNDDGSGYRMANRGLGPARIETFTVMVDGHPMKDWGEMIRAIGMPKTRYSFLVPTSGSYIKEAEAQTIFWVPPGAANDVLRANESNKIKLMLCYCSIYEDCWIATNFTRGKPSKVEVCPVPEVVFTSVSPSEAKSDRSP